MAEASSQIPEEASNFTDVPVFNNKSAISMGYSLSPSPCNRTKRPLSMTWPKKKTTMKLDCECPHVLLADDDNFQRFYYHTLFQRSLEFDGLSIERKDFRFNCLSNGEDLLEKFSKITRCGCNSPLLVIIDYYMGEENLNGVENNFALKKKG